MTALAVPGAPQRRPSRAVAVLMIPILLLIVLGGSGCATVPYHYGKDVEYIHGYPLPAGEPQFTYGTPNKFLDASGWIWPGSLFGKLILWNYKVDSHVVSSETVAAIEKYLADNELRNVKVRINDYCVRDEWSRTFRNKSIGPVWRFTMGFFSWLGYTVMPQRFFGGDNYNPYSNTLNIYSDIVAIGLHEGGHSKDFAQREYKGTYAVLYSVVPFFNLYPEALATRDALSYLRAEADRPELRTAYNVLYPAYGTYIGGDIGQFFPFPWNYAIQAGAVIPAHIVGRIRSATLPANLEPQAKPEPGQ